MVAPEKMKVNHFKEVRIPENKELYKRFGQYQPGENYFTGDEMIPRGETKVETLARIAREDTETGENA